MADGLAQHRFAGSRADVCFMEGEPWEGTSPFTWRGVKSRDWSRCPRSVLVLSLPTVAVGDALGLGVPSRLFEGSNELVFTKCFVRAFCLLLSLLKSLHLGAPKLDEAHGLPCGYTFEDQSVSTLTSRVWGSLRRGSQGNTGPNSYVWKPVGAVSDRICGSRSRCHCLSGPLATPGFATAITG